ncbi:MAG: MBG domain-containing protein, partial [Thermoguttaceae bacterium]
AVDANYDISYVAGTLTVTPASLTITADNQTMVYGGTLPAFTASYSGFVNGDTPASLTTPPALSTTATSASSVGSYEIDATGAVDANYDISYVAGTLTVTPASLTITADNQTMVYGGTVPTLTASYSGFVNGDTPASLTTPPALSTTATSASPVGNYEIDASGAVDANYDIGYVTGTLTIGPATLTWKGVSNGNWTDAQWLGANLPYPNSNVNAIVDTSNTVHVTSSQAANALAISNGGQVAVAAGLAITTDTSVTGGSTLDVDPKAIFSTGGVLTLDTGGILFGGRIAAAAYQLNNGAAIADLSGPGGLTKDTGGTVILSGSNSYAGNTVVNGGLLIVANARALPDGTGLTVGAGGILVFNASQSMSPIAATSALAAVPVATSTVSTPSPAISAASGSPAETPVGFVTSAMTTVGNTGQQLLAVAAPWVAHGRTETPPRAALALAANNAASFATPTVTSNVAVDAVLTSHRSAVDRTVASPDLLRYANAWPWLTAIESSWNSSDQNKMTDSTVAALDKVLAQYGV